MLLATTKMQNNQMVFLLAANEPSHYHDDDREKETDKYLGKISYCLIFAVIRQRDRHMSIKSDPEPSSTTLKCPTKLSFKTKRSSHQNNWQTGSLNINDGTFVSYNIVPRTSKDVTVNNPSRMYRKKVISKPGKRKIIERLSWLWSAYQMTNYQLIFVVPLLDDGEPYSSMVFYDFKLNDPFVLPDCSVLKRHRE